MKSRICYYVNERSGCIYSNFEIFIGDIDSKAYAEYEKYRCPRHVSLKKAIALLQRMVDFRNQASKPARRKE